MKRLLSLPTLVLLIVSLWLSACQPAAAPPPPPAQSAQPTDAPATSETTLTVFAAASLTDAFNEISSKFEAQHPGVKVTFNFAGSQQLRAQLEQGAVADVFASANMTEMNNAIRSKLVVSGTQQTFVRNRLTVIVPKDNRANVTTLQDLAKPGLKIVLAAPSVPVGGYALTALDKMNKRFGATFSQTVLSNVVSNEDNVKQVVAKVQLDEADAGIVYTSDVTPAAAEKLTTIAIPDEFNVIATYPIAALRSAPQPQLAADFVHYVLSDDSQSILRKWGFIGK